MSYGSFEVPPSLRWLSGKADSAAWLQRLPGLLRDVLEHWDLRLAGETLAGHVSYVVPVMRGEARYALKIQWPHPECLHEADALRHWDGDGAVRLIDHDRQRHALLLEWCEPGTTLGAARVADPLAIAIDVLGRLEKPAGAPFRSLAEEAASWLAGLHDDWEAAARPCEKSLVDAAYRYLDDLRQGVGEAVLLHQDLHGDNILAARRQPWLAIDPKPLAGERHFAAAPVVRSFELGATRRDTLYRFDRLTEELNLDRERARGWTVGQTMAWAFDSDWAAKHFQTVRWLLETR